MIKNYSFLFKSVNTSTPPTTIELEKRTKIKFPKLQISFKKVGLIVILAISMQAYSQIYVPNGVVNTSSNGNVGIDVKNPTQKLTISGNQSQYNTGYASYANSSKGILRIKANDGWNGEVMDFGVNIQPSYGWIQPGDLNNNQLYNLNLSPLGGNVGIGTTSPQYKLDINGHTSVGGYLFVQGADLRLGMGDGRPQGSNLEQRALVHAGNDALYINYLGDFEGGTVIGSGTYISNQGNASLQGKLEAKEVKVTTTPTADFVFAEDYQLPKLEEVEKYIKDKKHLPEIASAVQMQNEGVNIGEFQIKLLQKIEELTLYQIQMNKELKQLKEENKELRNQLKTK